MALREGATFAGYRIIRLLGSGGMGEVYLAEHPRLPRRDALKILPADLCADPQFRARFTREASLAATLFHPHIVGVHDRGESAGQLWISFDHVDGPDTAALLRSRHPAGMPPTEALSILSAIGSALDYAHARGLLHRDVKPANILLTEDPADQRRILLADFGIARALADISTLTATNTAMGTLLYAAPEQLAGGPIDGRADQYSLAATAFHLLTGCAPDRHSPPAVSALRPELSAFDGPIQTALARDPAHRHRSCRHFLEELLAAAGPMEISSAAATRAAPVNTAAPVVPEPAPAVGPARQPGGKGRILAAGVALGLLAGAAVLGVSRSEIPADYPVAQSPVAQSPVAQSPVAQSPVAQSLTPTTISVTATPVTSTVVAPPHTTTVTATVTATPTATSTTSERTAPDAALITSAGWNACTRSYPWSSCLDAARDAAGAPWSAAPPLTGDGTWPVPQSARYGDYRAAVGPMGRCQWSGYDVLGRMVDSGTFDMRGAPAVATVSPTMASFQSFGCTPWFRVTPLN